MLGESGPEHHAAAVTDPARAHLVLDDGAGLAGYLSLAAPRGPEPGVELHRLVVAADRRRTGLGHALLHLALDLCGIPHAPGGAAATATLADTAPGAAAPGATTPGAATPRCPEGHPRSTPRPEGAPGSDGPTEEAPHDTARIGHAHTPDTACPEGHPRSVGRPQGAPGGNGAGDGAGADLAASAGAGTELGASAGAGVGRRRGATGVVLDPGWTPPAWLAAGRIWLEVAPGNTAALRLYRAAGFVTETQLPSVPGDPASPPLRLILSRG